MNQGIADPHVGATDSADAVLVVNLAYNGLGFSGFAKQKDESLRTVQGCLEKALETLLGAMPETVCCGRTDAGVHALDQMVSMNVDRAFLEGKTSYGMCKSLNALTGDDIAVKNVALALDPDFSARFSTEWREYRYRIVVGEPPLFLHDFAWWHKTSLDFEAMMDASRYLVGEHDFKSFCKAQSAIGKNTVREIKEIELFTENQLGEDCLTLRVVGNAFLHSMIRTIVGTLVEVGEGRHEPAWVKEVLEACDRKAAGRTAPACGLVFHKVTYAPNSWIEF